MRIVKSKQVRSYELYVWLMTGRRYQVTFDTRPTEIIIMGGYIS